MAQSSPAPTSPSRELPPVTVDGHALFEFSLKINRALKRLEANFGASDKPRMSFGRLSWQQLPKKPR
jgi:hypothetical protein